MRFEATDIGVDGVIQGQLTTQGTIGPPAWQPAANGDRPEWVQSIGHVPKRRATTHAAAFDHGAVHRVMGVPVAGFIEGDRLFVGSRAGAAQAPAGWFALQFDAINSPLAEHEVAIGVTIHVAIQALGARL
ncbi:hypothetical protein D3C78_549810 [compost metagenome]